MFLLTKTLSSGHPNQAEPVTFWTSKDRAVLL